MAFPLTPPTSASTGGSAAIGGTEVSCPAVAVQFAASVLSLASNAANRVVNTSLIAAAGAAGTGRPSGSTSWSRTRTLNIRAPLATMIHGSSEFST